MKASEGEAPAGGAFAEPVGAVLARPSVLKQPLSALLQQDPGALW